MKQNYNAGSFGNNFTGGFGRKKRSAQFNQNYLPGSFSTNINYAQQYLGTFLGYVRKKCSAQFNANYLPGSFITNINNPIGFGGFGARGYGGVAFLGQQNYNAGSLGNNFAGGIWKKEKEDYFSSKLTFRIIRYQYQ